MTPNDFRARLLGAIPMLRAFARSLSGRRDMADDLVQETLARAIANQSRFAEGTNMNAWLVTILRNAYYSEHRRARREEPDPDGLHAQGLIAADDQHAHMEMRDFLSALQMAPEDQREALLMVSVGGMSYEEAAEALGVAVGTVKSRVSRARARLEELMSGAAPIRHSEEAREASARLLRGVMNPT